MRYAQPLPRSDVKFSAVERLLDSLSDAASVLDARGVVLYQNAAARGLLGPLIGQDVVQIAPKLGAELVAWLQAALRAGPAGAQSAGTPPRSQLEDGRRAQAALVPLDVQRYVLHLNPVPDAVPRATSMPSYAATSSMLLPLLANLPFPALLQDLDYRIVAVNKAYCDFTGYPESMLLGLDPISFVPEEDRGLTLAVREQQLRGEPVLMIDRRLVDAAGRERWFRPRRHLVNDEQGRKLYLAVMQERTDEHSARATAERALQELDQWFDLSPLGMVQLDASGLVVRGNQAFERLVGAAPVSMPEAPPALRELLGWGDKGPRPELQPGARPLLTRLLLPLPDGGVRCLQALVSCHEMPPGERHYMAAIEDRSLEEERDLLQAQLKALVDSAGVGLATFHGTLGWLPGSSPLPPLRGDAPGKAAIVEWQAIGRDVVEPRSLAQFDELEQSLRRGERTQVEYAVRHPQLGTRWLTTRVEPAQLASGERTTSVVTLDVTQSRETALRNEELLRELSTVLEGSSAGIAYFRGDRLVRCNQRFERLLGQRTGSLSGLALERLIGLHPQVQDLIDAARRALDEGPLFETEFPATGRGRGGQTRWYAMSVRRAMRSDELEATVLLTDITRLKAQQLELESLARDHELMFSQSEIGIAYLRAGRIERANEAMARLTGHPLRVLARMDHSLLFEDRAEYLRIGTEQRVALATEGHWTGERHLKRADGSLIWVQVSKRLVRAGDVNGGTIASYVNVDDRRRAEESLLLQSERTRAILDSVLVGIVTVGDAGIEWMNRSARRMFGGEMLDFLDHPIDLVATDDLEHPFRLTRRFLDGLAEGQAHTFECQVRARDGRTFWVAGNAVLTGRESTGRQLTFALLDIDRRRQAEALSAQTQASLQRIIEMAPMAITLHDAKTLRVLQANQIAAQSIARTVDDMLGRTPEDLYAAQSAAVMRNDMEAALAAGDAGARREYKLTGPDGRDRVWEVRYQPLTTQPGESPDQLLLVATDVTEQRAAEAARLEAAIAQREMLVKEVHHRIKNNLQGVAGLLQQIAQRRPEVAPALGEAIGQVQAIAHVYGLQVGSGGPLRVKAVVEAIVGSVQRSLGRPIGIVVQGDAPQRWALPEAESIPIALSVNELLTNAVKHGGDGELMCTMSFGPEEVRIAVSSPGRLPPGFDLARVPGGVTGLGLVRALLPRRSARFTLTERAGQVVATVVLVPPGVTPIDPL
jgi:PAS domain S-box-containing protein